MRGLAEIVESIASGEFYGLVECDISVPERLHSHFSEMAPVFKNTMVGREHLSPHMSAFAADTHHLRSPQRTLIGSLFGEKILLLSELARWYLKHGLVITRVYQLVRYVPRKVFSDFAQTVTEARRAGDADPELKLLADTSKLVGNSAYGKTITDKEKHRRVVYVDGSRQASQHIRGAGFISLNEITDDFYELEMAKSKVSTVLFTVSHTICGLSLLSTRVYLLLYFYPFWLTVCTSVLDRHECSYYYWILYTAVRQA